MNIKIMKGTWETIDRSFDDLLSKMGNNKVIIVGAGEIGFKLKEKLEENNRYPTCLFDNNKKKWTSGKDGKIRVQKPENLGNDIKYVIAIYSKEIRNQIYKQLLNLGIHEKNIFTYYPTNYQFWENLEPIHYQREISIIYNEVFDKELDWNNPKTYNEKLNWEKLYVRDPRRTMLADKYAVRKWVEERIGKQYLNTLYGVWDDVEDINFEDLPDAFVLKCNHGSGWNIIVKDKKELDIECAKTQLREWCSLNTFWCGFEYQYKDIQPKIIAEKYLEGLAETVYDYNIFCFHGEPIYILCIYGCHTKNGRAAFYDINWKKQYFSHKGYPYDSEEAPCPNQLEKILELSRILSKDFDHVRVDWYNMPDGTIYFGEMTFTTWNGLKQFEPEEWDLKFGELI